MAVHLPPTFQRGLMGNGAISTIVQLPDLTALAMKARFKVKCGSLGTRHKNWQIRVHRALSWLKRAGEFPEEQPEARYLYLWIALNSLYSRWDSSANAPGFDSQAREAFLRRICERDQETLYHTLREMRGLVKKLLENPYLSATFWKQPDHPQAKAWGSADAHQLDRRLRDKEICTVLVQVMHRLFIFRGQLVHGASSGGSRLNRGSLKYCLWALEKLVPIIVHLVIEHEDNDDWPDLCYPPIAG